MMAIIPTDNLILKEEISRTLTWVTWNVPTTTILLVMGMETYMTPSGVQGR